VSEDDDYLEERRRVANRRGRPTALADLIAGQLKPSLKRRGFASADLFLHWDDIVGPTFAGATRPERLSWPRRLEDGGEEGFSPAVLTVACEGARALLLQHEAPRLVDRINAFLGYGAVGKLRIIQKPVPRREKPRGKAIGPLGAGAEHRLSRILDGIDDPELRAVLEKLGRGVLSGRRA
jgi:hypothetical protein